MRRVVWSYRENEAILFFCSAPPVVDLQTVLFCWHPFATLSFQVFAGYSYSFQLRRTSNNLANSSVDWLWLRLLVDRCEHLMSGHWARRRQGPFHRWRMSSINIVLYVYSWAKRIVSEAVLAVFRPSLKWNNKIEWALKKVVHLF